MVDNWPTVESILADAENDAREVLRLHGVTDWPYSPEPMPGSPLPASSVKPEHPPIVRDANSLLWSVHAVRDAYRRGDFASAVMEAVAVGALRERVAVRPFEEPAKLGRESLKFWRGKWVRVTDLERDILTIIGERSEVPLSELLKRAWNDRAQLPTAKVRKALSQLNTKLAALRLPAIHLRSEKVIIE